MATVKRKRVSKKNKKSWRKHIDVTDVENFLEEQRLEERLGVKFSEQKNEDLFTLDTTGAQPGEKEIKPLFRKPTLRLKESTIPKCFSILERRSAVPDPIKKRNHVKVREKVRNYLPEKKRAVKDPPSKVNFRDIWSETDKTRELNGLTEWLTPDTIRHTLHNTGHKNRLRSHGLKQKPSVMPAVEVPHPGMSYNPSLLDHNALLREVASTEQAIEKDEAHIARVTTKMFRKIPREEAEKSYMSEMSIGLVPSSDSESDRGDYSTVNPPAQRKKKTLKTRRKIKEEIEKKHSIERAKMEKKKRSDVNNRLTNLKKQIETAEDKSLAYQDRRNTRLQEKALGTKVLSHTKYTPAPLEFQSPSELSGSLRKLIPEGSVLGDRFASLQKRNVLEPTQRRHVTKTKVKRFVKGSHKMGWESKGF